MVEGARLESVYTGNRIAGSNPACSASLPVANLASDPNGAKFSRCFKGVWPGHPNRRDWRPVQFPSPNGPSSLTERTSLRAVRLRESQRFQPVPSIGSAHLLRPFSRLASPARERAVGIARRARS